MLDYRLRCGPNIYLKLAQRLIFTSYCDTVNASPCNTKHLYNIYTVLEQRRRRWADVGCINFKQMFCVYWEM